MREIVVAVRAGNKRITPIETIEAIKNAGYSTVFIQWYNRQTECTQEEQLKLIHKLGLNVIFAHLGYKGVNAIWEEGEAGNNMVEYYKKDIDVCKENNIPMVIMHLTTSKIAPPFGEIGLNRIKDIVNHAKEKDMKIAFENTKIKGYIDYVLSNIKDSHVGFCLDSGHLHVHFDDDFNFEMFKDRIFAVHLHDNDKTDDLHLLPFEGTIDWVRTVKNLRECNYKGPVTLELNYSNHYLEMAPVDFYKKGYETGIKLSKMLDDERYLAAL